MATHDDDLWILGVVLGLLGSVAINTGNNLQSLGLKKLKEQELEELSKGIEVLQHGRQERSSVKHFRTHKRPAPLNGKIQPLEAQFHVSTDDGQSRASLSDYSSATAKEQYMVKQVNACDAGEDINPSKSNIWLVGTLIFVSGSLFNFASYAFGAQSMLASLESIQFVTNLIFGKYMLGCTVTGRMALGTFLIVTGTVLSVQFSSKDRLDFTIDDIISLYQNPKYIAYVVFVVALLVILQIAFDRFELAVLKNRPMKYTDSAVPLIYSVWSAIFGTQSVVQAKVLAELLEVQSRGKENIFQSWFLYFTILMWLSTVAVWLRRLNNALRKFNPLFIIPLLQCSFIFFTIISGGIFFKEFDTFNGAQWLGFWCGNMVMMSGLMLLTPKPQKYDSLPKDIIELLLCSGIGFGVEGRHYRLPRTPRCTPREKLFVNDEQCNRTSVSSAITCTTDAADIPIVHMTGNNNGIERSLSGEKPEPPLCVTGMIMETVKGVVIDSAQTILKSPTGTVIMTSALSSENAKDSIIRHKIEEARTSMNGIKISCAGDPSGALEDRHQQVDNCFSSSVVDELEV
mmetsp:Transcript_24666/g.38106  ORF Transcript_24666/g.38106 Transcript_24666/m.38106 type:complete len:571 (-) Transcript_24666:446-2158(-)|eukprot:CAMPEP_0196827186 /NCGR_PEP_ID=MMETSP1362-20130617/94022_1 /TAXON_ID=163516 /ORGANISM="Leptocylindrus danicus, Strain CCMP1856" /LENGTH=570 /DNA_ID=CAMNT_0042207807 /DNA_START=1499 /DNA_END=3211 /DNA_ORIENTATION=-